uniref:Uncharacterized protein n=1 Tax=Arundo donax TaxID=35708 RepID=A0A0A9A416_ARUDO
MQACSSSLIGMRIQFMPRGV